MIDNQITRNLFLEGKVTFVEVPLWQNKQIADCFKCKVSKVIVNTTDFILKLKTPKNYPLGHKYIFRSIEEVI